jgi:hypothetical protein
LRRTGRRHRSRGNGQGTGTPMPPVMSEDQPQRCGRGGNSQKARGPVRGVHGASLLGLRNDKGSSLRILLICYSHSPHGESRSCGVLSCHVRVMMTCLPDQLLRRRLYDGEESPSDSSRSDFGQAGNHACRQSMRYSDLMVRKNAALTEQQAVHWNGPGPAR